MKTLLFALAATALVVVCSAQRRPPSYSLDDMPQTSFDCRDKILGGYYADPETDCQMFHVCVKVPGVGVQNYKFLCPNDTAFDQESQICASWYDVDCEAALLYSDNFDLYRIGYVPSSPAVVSKATALPPTAAPVRGRQPYNSRLQPQPDDDYYLQAGDTGDRRLQPKDVLRGSSTGNFFNQKKGREEEDTSVLGKKKVAVRKFRKRPQEQTQDEDSGSVASTAAPTTFYSTSGNTYLPRYNTIQRNNAQTDDAVPQQRRGGFLQRAGPTTPAPPSTYQAPPSRNTDNYNYQAQQNNYNYPSSTPAPRNNYNYQAETKPTYNAPSPTASTSLNNNYNYQTVQRNNNNLPSTTVAPSRGSAYYNNENSAVNNDFSASTAAPTASTSYQQRNGNAQRYDTFAPVTTFSPNSYSTRGAVTNNEYDAYGNTLPQRFKNGRESSRTTAGNTAAVTSAPFVTETYQRNNNYNQRGNVNAYSTTTPKPAYTYYDEYQAKNTGSSEDYNNYNPNNYDYQRTNYNSAPSGQYTGNERVEGESLKTAPSNNYGPNSYNSFQNTYNEKSAAEVNQVKDANQNTYNTGSANQGTYNTGNANQNTYNTGNSNTGSNDNKDSSIYYLKQSGYNPTNTSAQQTTKNTYYSAGVTNQPTTSNLVSAFTIRAASRNTDAVSGSYEARSSYSSKLDASTSVTGSGRSSYYTQTTAADAVTTLRPQYTQSTGQKQYSGAQVNQGQKLNSGKPAIAANSTVPANKKTGDVAYDYAYYDETAPSEYDGLDPISDRHFGKESESLKVARATK